MRGRFRYVVLACLLSLPQLVSGAETKGKCRTPDGKTYKTTPGLTSQYLDVKVVNVTRETQSKYIEIIEDEIETEIDHENNWAWIKFNFTNKSNKAIATIFVFAVFYDENDQQVYESETRVFNNRSCKSNYPLKNKKYIARGMGFIENVPPQAVKVEWYVNKIGFAIEL